MIFLDKSISSRYTDHKKVYRLIREHGPVSKSKLVSISGHTLSTLNRIIYDLINAGFINTTETGESTGGRKPQLFSLNPNAGYMIGVDIARMYTRVALMDLNCIVLKSEAFGMFKDSTPEKTVEKICTLISDFCSGIEHNKLLGIGVGTVGPIDRDKGIILTPVNFPNAEWENIRIKDMLQEKIKLMTLVENGVNAAALGEYLNGSGKGFSNVAYITAGIGLRLGLVANGKLVRSINNYRGGFGHLKVDNTGPRCYCGNVGCLETFISIPEILNRFKDEIGKGRSSSALQKVEFDISAINLDTFCDAVESQDSLANEILEAAAKYLSMGLLAIENIVAPELVILGGSLIKKCDLLYQLSVKMALEKMQKCSPSTIQFSKGTFGENAVVVGVGNLVLDYHLQ